jgi:signal transduction histidine kinase
LKQEHLGLFDTPPDRHEVRFAFAIVGVLVASLLYVETLQDVRLAELDSFVPAIDSILIVSDLIVATLLYAQASVFRSRALTVLASGYVFGALMLIPHVLTFPGAFAPTGLLGAGPNTTSWTFMFRRLAFPIAIIVYALLKRGELAAQPEPGRPRAGVTVGLLTAVAAALAFTALATLGHDLLPQLYVNRVDANLDNMLKFNVGYFALGLVAVALLLRQRKSLLDMWLLVALSGWMVHLILILTVLGRFTVGFYYQALVVVASSLVVMFALIAESNRLYARLAVATSARKREREARLMSMDAVTAAISHEVGQPLTASSLNASAALNWLTQPKPDVSKAVASLQAIGDANKRTFDVIRSIRAMFAKGAGPATELNLNDLVRETASLLDKEMIAVGISLELALEDPLPTVRADRVQIQRVLINLLTNAIESLGGNGGRQRRKSRRIPREIRVRSGKRNGDGVLLEVSDTGPGIPADELERIFDPFVTSKAAGTGLGLSLCQSIIEDHGGRLWASRSDEYGATFHLTLPAA